MQNKHIRSVVIIIGLIVLTVGLAVGFSMKKSVVQPPVQQSLVSPSGKLTIDNLSQNQTVVLPITVTGMVQGWFFEGSFPVFMKDSLGNQIGVGLAHSSQDWMTANPIPFSVTLPATAYVGTGTLVFHNDNPSGEPQNDDSYVVNVIFQ